MRITETERLFIEEATPEDASFFLILLNTPNWITYIGDRNIKTEEEAAQYISAIIVKSYHDNGFGLYKLTVKEDNKPIGICGFVKRNYLPHADIGFALLPEFEGKGYAYEAAKSLMQYGFTRLLFSTLLAVTLAENGRSQKLLYKLGFTDSGTIQPDINKPPLLLYST